MAGLIKKPPPARNPTARGTTLPQLIREAAELAFELEVIPASHLFDEGQSLPSSRYVVFNMRQLIASDSTPVTPDIIAHPAAEAVEKKACERRLRTA